MPSLADTPIHMAQVGPPGMMMSGPIMVPLPTQFQFVPAQGYHAHHENVEQVATEETKQDGHSLYLCKDDFQPIEEFETVQLKDFLVKQLIKVTQTSQGWAPEFTLAKQNSTYRHEMITRDGRSRDWLLNLDFSEFGLFNVLVYTTEELWYERAAVWLPGHSRYRNIDPLTKLKLQNKRLEGVNIGKWKLVKKVLNEKGTRLYVDMPPSSARALEKHKMQLTYELQKVNVFLKAVAIDKEAFDTGLSERSIEFVPGPSLTPMPLIHGNDKDIIQIAFKGNKPLTLALARKVKDTIIYKMYKYHQLDGKSKTDFVKYGFCQPGYFCILPENAESRKWLRDLDLGKINRTPLIIIGEDDIRNKYFNMSIILPADMKAKFACERLKQSNQGVKGINFNLWKNQRIENDRSRRHSYMLNVDMDLESIETIAKMKYKLDLVVENREYIVEIVSNLPLAKLEEKIAKCKAELSDKYDVSNMDLASDSDEDIICLD
nr:uncharacterized protein LOC117993878 isoform X1 [Maniola hyperantus]